MPKCCAWFVRCKFSESYQPLQAQGDGTLGSMRPLQEDLWLSSRAAGSQIRKLSVRYDAVRVAACKHESEQPTSHRLLPGTLRSSQNHPQSNPHPYRNRQTQDNRHEPPPTSHPSTPRTCALHSRLDQPVTSSTPGMDNKKVVQAVAPPAPVQVRRKSGGEGLGPGLGAGAAGSGVRRRSGPQGLRSPAAKRPLSAPVALQGWLHKQGSEGLMLWKRRWFVLSEYCLFYYKGPEEEKLLGSILLPSYRVTVCRPEDKVNKKFAFKAEHANMRTYHFAADSREIMNQWMNALTLASLLQDPNPGGGEAAVALEIAGPADGDRSARPSVSSISSILNQSADDSDSGFHGFQSRDDPSHASNNNSSPNSVNTASFPNISNNLEAQPQPVINGWMQSSPQYGQPGPSQQQQYVQLPSTSQQHPHQHQPQLHQHLQHQHVPQQMQQAQPGPSNVQTVQPMARNFGQPLYANAPPKPRRLTDGSNEYSTPSPDPGHGDFRKSPVSPDVRMSTKSPMSEYDRNSVIYMSRVPQQPQQALRTDKSGLNYGYGQPQATERRTPDTYGRSTKTRSSRGTGDYEDVYAGPQLYQRPAGPVGYTKGAAPAPIPIAVYAQQQQQQSYSAVPPQNAPVMRQPRAQPPARPHSADFLEHEVTWRPQQLQHLPEQTGTQPTQQRRPQRPKSSLDVVTPADGAQPGDRYFYSEERYAAQMRQSAVYLHQTPPPPQQQHHHHHHHQITRATTPSKSSSPRERDAESGVGSLSEASSSALRRSQRGDHITPSQPSQRPNEVSSSEALLRRSLRERSYKPLIQSEGGTVPRRMACEVAPRGEYDSSTGGRVGSHGGTKRWSEQQFARSASARLPRTRHPAAPDQDDDESAERSSGQDSRDGERKIQQREESMKRLLEWKQRMLQSPLTRKPSSSANRGAAQNELSSFYKQQALLDLAAHEATVAEARHRRKDDGHRPHVRSKSTDGRRSVTNVSRYNSYSSDDEELGDVRRKRTRRPSHAGRSPRHVGHEGATISNSDTVSPGNSRSNAPKVPFGSPPLPNDYKNYLPSCNSVLLGGIPPDAGYEEIGFSSMSQKEPPMSRTGPISKSAERRQARKESASTPSEENITKSQNLLKKPTGILKTSTLYPAGTEKSGKHEGRLSTLAGYIPNETWQSQKNVQWNAKDEKEDWDSKIDESRVIKEFSYQYIQPEESVESERNADSSGSVDKVNLVQSRIRSIESSLDDTNSLRELLSMQEPLKVSPPQSTEAHVSRLDSSRKTAAIRDFALGDSNVQVESLETEATDDSSMKQAADGNKSVKDLLADFERKSQQVREQEIDKSEEVQHRGVFSDTETLLYDTGSDLDHPGESEEDDGQDHLVPSSENGVAYKGTIRRVKNVVDKRRMRKNSKGSMNDQGLTSSDLEVIMTPGYMRLSMTESLVTHGDQLSGESASASPALKPEESNPEEHYLPMSPRKAILDPTNDERPNPKMMESLFANLDHEESSYVEMTQNGIGHSLLAPSDEGRKHDSGDYSTLDTPHYEFVCVADNKMEPVYMEVSQLAENNGKDLNKKSPRRRETNGDAPPPRPDLPDILTALKSDSSDADDESSKDLDSLDAPRHPRFSLSDTFRPASYYLGASRALIAELHDSSDSELVSPPPIPTSPPPLDDLDSLEIQESLEVKKVSPQVAVTRDSLCADSPKSWSKPAGQVETHRSPSRFSDATISSTFRDSRMSLESASGSDSVELRNPEEEARHRQMKRRPVSDEVCEVLDSLDELESLGSRFDGASIDLDQYLEELQARDAFNVDLYAKDLSYNSIYGFNENMMVADKLQKTTSHDISGKINLASNISLDQPFRYGARSKTSSASSLPSMRVSDRPPSHQHSQSFTGDAHYENIASFSPLRGSPAIRSDNEQNRDENYRLQKVLHHNHLSSHSRESSYSLASGNASISTSLACQRPSSAQSSSMPSPIGSVSSENHTSGAAAGTLQSMINYTDQRSQQHSREASQDSSVRYSLSPNHRSSSSQDSSLYPPSTSTVKASPQMPYNLNQVQNDQTGAPYYYSDLQAGVSSIDAQIARSPMAHTSRLPQLNNQRGDTSGLNKRNDIGRMVNPIPRHMPRQIQVEDIDEARRIAAELRKTSTLFLNENKVGLVDKRNVYEADTLRRVKSTDPLPDVSLPDVNSRNLYPHGLRDKSGSQTQIAAVERTEVSVAQASHRRSRSLEGLLDDAGLQNLVDQRNRSNRVASVPPTQTQEIVREAESYQQNTEDMFEGEDPWEQDSLWRESLRRVSLRHARSLDNLEAQIPLRAGRASMPPESRNRPRITRGATYVNDSVALRREATEEVTERPRIQRRVNENRDDEEEEDDRGAERSNLEEEDAYERLAMDRIGAGGYIWDPENEAYRKPGPDETNHFLAEGNLPPAPVTAEARASTSTSASFEIDREKLRQWDLLSSACLLQEQQRTSMTESGRGLPTTEVVQEAGGEDVLSTSIRTGGENLRGETVGASAFGIRLLLEDADSERKAGPGQAGLSDYSNATASGSGSVIGRDPLPPRAVSTSQLPQRTLTQPPTAVSTLPLARANNPHLPQQPLPVHQVAGVVSRPLERTGAGSAEILRAVSNVDVRMGSVMSNSDGRDPRLSSPGSSQSRQELSVQRMVSTAGPLRVISPIEHRMSSPSDNERQMSSPSERTMNSPIGRDADRGGGGGSGSGNTRHTHRGTNRDSNELLNKRARLAELDTPRRLENLQKLEELKKHLMDLEKQYEKGKPLVNLVDNMVKLGSLYNRGTTSTGNGSMSGSRHDLLQMQENAREHRDRLEFNQRVQEQRLLAEERRDWDRLSPDHGQLQAKVQQLYKLDRLLQEESGTLHSLQQDKEILEKALGGLRHKLQGSRSNPAEVERYRKQQLLLERELSKVRLLLAHNSKKLEETVAENARLEQELVVLRQKLQASRRYAGNMVRDSSGTTAALEAELRRVQQLVGDLQRQRQELSVQVRHLTEKSHSLVQQIRPQPAASKTKSAPQVHHSKKRAQSSWLETDLDSGMTLDHGLDSPSSPALSSSPRSRQNGSPSQRLPSPQYKDPPAPYKDSSHQQHLNHSHNSQQNQLHNNHSHLPLMKSVQAAQNHISALSPQLREQIQQHQLKQQQLRDQMQGKSSPIQANITPLYINTDSRRLDSTKHDDSGFTNGPVPPPEYLPPPPPPPSEEALMNGNHAQNEDNKFIGLMQNREKQEIKTVRIVKRESERRQKDRGDRTGNIGIPLTNGLQVPGSAKRLNDDDFGGSQQFEKAQLGRVVEESPLVHAQSSVHLAELEDIQFQRSMSLPRGFGGQRLQPGIHQGPVLPPPRSDSMNALRNMMVRRHRVRFENQDGSSDSTLSPYMDSPSSSSQMPMSSPNPSASPSQSPSLQSYPQHFSKSINQQTPSQYYPMGGQYVTGYANSPPAVKNEPLLSPLSPGPISPVSAQERLFGSIASITSLTESPQLSPVFKSEAAKQIIKEMTEKKVEGPRRRQVPKEKRRHYTVSSSKPVLDLEDTFSKMGMGRARDDLDMERALRPRINAPDVVRSTLSHKELKYNESTIDQLLGTPNKIFIPERYIPEQTPELTAEEQEHRLKKAESIRKMLSETTVTTHEGAEDELNVERSGTLKRKVAEEKRQREHILQLNQILAKQVMEKSKMVAVKALATLPLNPEPSFDEDDLSPVTPLPLYQQRDNFYS